MNWRWLWFDYVPPVLELPATQKRRARRKAWARFAPSRRDKLMFLAAAAPFLLGNILCLQVCAGARGSNAAIDLALMLYATGLSGTWALTAIIGGRTFGRVLYGVLADLLSSEICGQCGYLLKGLDDRDHRCPECGSNRAAGPALSART
jgi:hypothetical protein